MKTKTNKFAIWAGLLLCTAVGTYAVPVTFQVNMDYQINNASPAFNPPSDTVEIKGSFNTGWNDGVAMTNVPNTTLYQNTVDITTPAPGNVVEYKFHIYGTQDTWESLDWYPNGNRRFTLDNSPQTIPTAYFADNSGGAQSIEVTFQVDMSAQIGVGNFNPGAGDLIQAMGPFNGSWSGVVLNSDSARPGIYTNSYVETSRAPGTRMEYKYAINVGGGGTLDYESISGYPDNNRAFLLADVSPQVLPVEFFSDASGLPIKAGIYFQLDMSSQILVGAFDPLNDLASVRGGDLGWGDPPGSGLQLFEDAARPGIYTNTWLKDNQLTGAAFTYKYTYFRNANTIWEGGADKSVAFVGNEPTNSAGYHMIVLGPTLFDNWQANTNDYLPADTYVTFTVSMTNNLGNPVQSYEGFEPLIVFDRSQQVAVNGNWVPWWNWAAAAPLEYTLTNGTSGDWLYSQTVLIPKGKPVQLVYKYGMDDGASSLDNEGGYGADHVRYIRQTGSYTLALDYFGAPTVEDSFGNLTIGAPAAGSIPVSWLGRPGVFLQTSDNLINPASWVTHSAFTGNVSSTGIYSTNYPASAGATFFRLVKPAP
ncbi:MAG TPA: CBM20 domain-containing protein [Verrucomicrobiota bacterium]|jgi:hypothetical protein|nr:CBM20 domain-containing protein [Verrucomicrobiota bacterium]